jgi:hypothetical protein
MSRTTIATCMAAPSSNFRIDVSPGLCNDHRDPSTESADRVRSGPAAAAQ